MDRLTQPLCHAACSVLGAAAALVPAAAAKAADDAQGVASSRMSYSRFLEYLDMGRVKKVCVFVVMCGGHVVCSSLLDRKAPFATLGDLKRAIMELS